MPRLLQYSDVENVYDDPVRAGCLAGCLRALDGDDALVVGTGDNTAPGVVSLAERGRQAVDLFEVVGTDVETFGNHDFDYGPGATLDVVRDSPQRWVSANIFTGAERFGAADGVVPWCVVTVGDVRVGFFGVTDPATHSLNPMAADLDFSVPTDAAREAVSALCTADADFVVALSHLGAGDDALARVEGVDVVLGGHVHSRRLDRVDGTLCTRPGVNGDAVVEVDLDAETATLHETADADPFDPLVESLSGRVDAAGLSEVVGHVSEPMARDHDTVFGGECRVGNLVADAYRWATDADVGLQNSGGIRSGPPLSGDVTVADLVSLVPFEEQVVRTELSGAELLDILGEASGMAVDFGELHWWHGHISGATIQVADGAVTEVTVDGQGVDPESTYTLATSDYLLHTDHEFPTLGQHHRTGEAGIQYEVLADYVRTCGLDGTVEGRIVQRGVNSE